MGLMTRHEKVHVFVETHALDGIELSGLPGYMKRAMPLFGKVSRFGRVAIVADQTWWVPALGSRARCFSSSAIGRSHRTTR